VAGPSLLTAAQEAEEARPVARDEYPTEVFSMVSRGVGTVDPDSGTEVADEWEKALRGEPSPDRSGAEAHQDRSRRDEHGEHGEQVGSDEADEHDSFDEFDQPAAPRASGQRSVPAEPVERDRTAQVPEPAEHDEHERRESPERSEREDAHQRAETQVFPRFVDEDEPDEPSAPAEAEHEGPEKQKSQPGVRSGPEQPAEHRSAGDFEHGGTHCGAEDSAVDGTEDQWSDLPVQLFGSYPGTDERVETAIIPRFIDGEYLDGEHGSVPEDGRDAGHQADYDEGHDSDGTAGSDRADASDEHKRDERPGETTELIPAYLDEDHEDHREDFAEPAQQARPAGNGEPEYLDPIDPGLATWERKRRVPEPAVSSAAGPERGGAAPGERTELVAAYRDEAPEQPEPGLAAATEVATEAPGRSRSEVSSRSKMEAAGWTRSAAPTRDSPATENFAVHPDEPEDQPPPARSRAAVRAEPAAEPGAALAESAALDSAEEAVPGRRKPLALVLVLLVLAVFGGVGAYYFDGEASEAALAYPTVNRALVDKPATAQVIGDVTKAIEAAYSYDSTQLDASENRALGFLTGSYVDELKRNFDQVRQLGPQLKVSLQSTVSAIGVEFLSDDNAKLLVMLNQVGHRGDNTQPLTAYIRLSVSAEKVGGQWKVSGVDNK
jgi:Mce-associated membrane protein